MYGTKCSKENFQTLTLNLFSHRQLHIERLNFNNFKLVLKDNPAFDHFNDCIIYMYNVTSTYESYTSIDIYIRS